MITHFYLQPSNLTTSSIFSSTPASSSTTESNWIRDYPPHQLICPSSSHLCSPGLTMSSVHNRGPTPPMLKHSLDYDDSPSLPGLHQTNERTACLRLAGDALDNSVREVFPLTYKNHRGVVQAINTERQHALATQGPIYGTLPAT